VPAEVTEERMRMVLPTGRSTSLNSRVRKTHQPAGVPLSVWWLTGEPDSGDNALV
jgi:hypothetical protein